MKCLKSIINMGLANGWMTVNHFGNIKYKEKKVVREFLTREEINILRNKEFDIPWLEMVRDIFLFCCYGVSLADVSHDEPVFRKFNEKTVVATQYLST